MTTNPFDTAKAAAHARREQEAAAAAERIAQQREEREQRARRLLIEQYREYVARCRTAFYESVAKHAIEHKWSESGIDAAQAYCTALAYQGEGTPELPNASREMKQIIHEIFVRKIVFYGDKLPERAFFGQKMDWYPDMLQQVQKPARPRSYKPRPPQVKIPTPGEVFPPASEQEKNDNVVELRPAITPSKKVKKARSAG